MLHPVTTFCHVALAAMLHAVSKPFFGRARLLPSRSGSPFRLGRSLALPVLKCALGLISSATVNVGRLVSGRQFRQLRRLETSRPTVLRHSLALLLLLSHAPVRGQETQLGDTSPEVAQAVAVLASSATREEKVNACRRLAAWGGPESIASLAALLVNEDLSHAARMGLEAIPDPAAGEALRAALPKLAGATRIGVINSLAARRETNAVADLGQYLTDPDPQVASAACAALGKIASSDALTLLENAEPTVSEEVRPEWGRACLRGVTTLREQGLDDRASRLCQLLRQSQLPSYLHSAATRQAMLIHPDEARSLLDELLASAEDASFAMALTVSREIDSSEVTQALTASLSTLPTSRQSRVIEVLGDRGDPLARQALVEYASSRDLTIRAAAVRALGQTGDASTFPLLLTAANDSEPEIVAAAEQAMVALQDDNMDNVVKAALAEAEGPLRSLLIDVVGQRRIESAATELIPFVKAPDVQTRRATIRALGQVIDHRQLAVLTERLLAPIDVEERKLLEQALRAVCRRTTDAEACSRQLQTSLPQLDQETKTFVIELLGTVGGSTALEAVTALASDREDAIQDAATQALGRWRTSDVAPALIELARTAPQEKYRIRALRGYLRVIRQMDLPDTDKLAMYRQAFDAAMRSEERVLALEALGRIPTPDAMQEAVSRLEDETLQHMACVAAVTIAERLDRGPPQVVVEAMRRVLAATEDPEITRRAHAVLARQRG